MCIRDRFRRKFGKDLSKNARAMRRLRTAAERAKRMLSSSTEANIEVDNLEFGIDFNTKISRARFEELCTDLFRSTWVPVEKALVDAKLKVGDIDEIVLVGGSTRIPKIQSLLQNFFHGKQLNTSVNPDEAVAYGAAIQAAMINGDRNSALLNVLLFDVAPLSLGIETAGGIMTTLIERNTRIPCEKFKIFSTHVDNQNGVTVAVYEGERVMVKDNNLLGLFDLMGIPPAPKGIPQIGVSFNLDANGILNVTARDNATGITERIVINKEKGGLSKEEIDKMIKQAEEFREADQKQKKKVIAKNNLESYIFSVKQAIEEAGDRLSKKNTKSCLKECENILSWLDADVLYEQDEYEHRLKMLSLVCAPLVKLYGAGILSTTGCRDD